MDISDNMMTVSSKNNKYLLSVWVKETKEADWFRWRRTIGGKANKFSPRRYFRNFIRKNRCLEAKRIEKAVKVTVRLENT